MRREQIAALLRAGHRPREVARALGVTGAAVHNMSSYLRRIGADVPPAHSHDADDQETRGQARKRVAREVAAGARCQRCWLLKPCDHE